MERGSVPRGTLPPKAGARPWLFCALPLSVLVVGALPGCGPAARPDPAAPPAPMASPAPAAPVNDIDPYPPSPAAAALPHGAPSETQAPETQRTPPETQAPSESPSRDAASSASTPPETDQGGEDESSANADPARSHTPIELPAGTTVLHVGDSFADALGLPLKRLLEARDVRAVLEAETASYIPGWSSYGKIERLLGKHDPDLVLITLGANELEIGEPEQRIRNIRRIVGIIGERPCVWIATPLWAGPKNGLMDIIRDNVAPCLYMDTNALIESMPRIRDGIHPTSSARENWARVVVQWLASRRIPTAELPWALRGDAPRPDSR